MTKTATDQVHVASLAELEKKGCIVVHGADRPIAVFYNSGTPRAVDNRCPHLGFPLHKGSCHEGIITCHWHHARFDAASGCTFDAFAGDVPAYDLTVRDGQVYVADRPRPGDIVARGKARLREGMEQNVGLVSAKAVLALRDAGVSANQIVSQAILFGVNNRDGWGSGLTILTAMANVAPLLTPETAYFALYQGVIRTAGDAAGQAPRRQRQPLETHEHTLAQLQHLLRYWVKTHHRNGVERTLLTAVHNGCTPAQIAMLVGAAATDRLYADGGHLLDGCNKALEALDLLGWEHAADILPALAGPLASARGEGEFDAWRHPIDLVPLVEAAAEQLAPSVAAGQGKSWNDEVALAQEILGDDPQAILAAIVAAAGRGATAGQLGKALCLAAAQRIARFANSNDVNDWITALHSFTFCNAVDRLLARAPDPLLLRGVLQGAMSVYQARFLNVPAAKLPGERGALDHLPSEPAVLLQQFLDALDSQRQMDHAAALVARYLQLGHPLEPLLDRMALAVVREDANFHTFQMLEAAIAQQQRWGRGPQGDLLLIALARYLAAHSPTQRAQGQMARVALRLHRGENVYEEE